MDLLYVFREPVSAWSHCSWLLLSLPGTFWLWRRSNGDRAKQWSLLVFGLSLALCYASSTLYHGARLSAGGIAVCNLLDYVGIYVLIAGSYTPLAWNLLQGRWRQGTLLAAWAMAALGIALQLAYRTLPQSVSTGLYLGMGWGAIFCYFEIARVMTHRPLRLILAGGVLYTVGAVLNLLEWPSFYPGVFGAHELFHLFVMAGSLCHFAFMLTVVAPSRLPRPCAVPSRAAKPRPAPQPRPVPVLVPVWAHTVKTAADRLSQAFTPKLFRP